MSPEAHVALVAELTEQARTGARDLERETQLEVQEMRARLDYYAAFSDDGAPNLAPEAGAAALLLLFWGS